ncbi:hypothetical protein MKQ70_32400 [Chitinophaga sedimenti]|uniref:hypothetical protein n=1 Tax=Chitinophaga sedimenti TaxID=2033606 RepID=UPI00200694D4|nr:hypothetical protein [Chitinophaga sedimenti]MCK7559419.1 hypothetical protein [Chitinophaga sedimenti]
MALDHQTLYARITNADGAPLMELLLDKEGSRFKAPGVYLGVAAELLSDDEGKYVKWGVLSSGAAVFEQQQGKILYTQVAAYENGQLNTTAGYKRFSSEVRDDLILNIWTTECGDMEPTQSRVSAKDRFVLSFSYEDPKHGSTDDAPQFYSFIGFKTPEAAFRMLDRFPDQVFTKLVADSHKLPLRMTDIRLFQDSKIIAHRTQDASKGPVDYQILWHQIDLRAHEAIKKECQKLRDFQAEAIKPKRPESRGKSNTHRERKRSEPAQKTNNKKRRPGG